VRAVSPNGQPVLILGGSGYIGRHLYAKTGPEGVRGTYCRHPFGGGSYFDALTMRVSDIVAPSESFSCAFVLLGDTKPDSCARNVERARRLNVECVIAIIDQLRDRGIVPVFTSSEVVFDGEKGGYIESDPVRPLMVYGAQKVEVEDYLRKNVPEHLIVRCARVVGVEPGDGTLFTSWMEPIARGENLRCATDHVFSTIHVDDVIRALLCLVQIGARGTFHVAGPEGLSRVEMLRRLIACYRRWRPTTATVTECRMRDFVTLEPRPRDVSLRPDKLVAATGLRIRTVSEYLEDVVENWLAR
jgi:dTDP-4-dehydrorhamnose reductase